MPGPEVAAYRVLDAADRRNQSVARPFDTNLG
jgi:hypothetical protein